MGTIVSSLSRASYASVVGRCFACGLLVGGCRARRVPHLALRRHSGQKSSIWSVVPVPTAAGFGWPLRRYPPRRERRFTPRRLAVGKRLLLHARLAEYTHALIEPGTVPLGVSFHFQRRARDTALHGGRAILSDDAWASETVLSNNQRDRTLERQEVERVRARML